MQRYGKGVPQMEDFSINEMQKMQRALQEKYKDKWEPIGPETGKNKLSGKHKKYRVLRGR